MSKVEGNPEAFAALTQSTNTGRVVMVNLLKFKKDGGQESYAEYGKNVGPMVQAHGGRVIFAGAVDLVLAGDDTWDVIALVEYPSRKDFLAMVTSPEYQKFTSLRTDGLEDARLYVINPATDGAGLLSGEN